MIAIIAGIVSLLSALFAAWSHGRSSGEKKAEATHLAALNAVASRVDAAMAQVNKRDQVAEAEVKAIEKTAEPQAAAPTKAEVDNLSKEIDEAWANRDKL